MGFFVRREADIRRIPPILASDRLCEKGRFPINSSYLRSVYPRFLA